MEQQRIDSLISRLPGVDADLVREHCARIGARYFEIFDDDAIAAHLQLIAQISPDAPAGAIVSFGREYAGSCTVIASDYPGIFSLITGVLGAMGFQISSGEVFTYRRSGPPARGRAPRAKGKGRAIIDHFSGSVAAEDYYDAWEFDLRAKLLEVTGLVRDGGADAMVRARQLVNEMVVDRLRGSEPGNGKVLYPVSIDVAGEDNAESTRMRIIAADSPFFLYSVSSALSLQGIQVEQVAIHTVGTQVEDEFLLVDYQGRKLDDPVVIDHLKLSVLLAKQFTWFLVNAPDPYAALSRFDQLISRIAALPEYSGLVEVIADPAVMRDLAAILGASDYLWEDFIRLQYESILPMLRTRGAAPFYDSEGVPTRLRRQLALAKDRDDERRILNDFKNREIYLLDLDQILGKRDDFRGFAERLTLLAEAVIGIAAERAYERLRERHGVPRTAGGVESRYAVFGLGKMGGAALGYASDVEVLLVYGDSGRTDGGEPVENSEFYENMVREILFLVQAKKDGIFTIDLRLRPHGNDGPLAVSLETFCRYYGPGGPAHSYERLALVRLRAFAGDAELGSRIERLRDEYIYETESVRSSELHEVRQRQLAEKSKPGKVNAKFSPGGLVDLEYSVQMLQVAHGREIDALRTPRIHRALDALAESGVLDSVERDQLIAAYDFLRRLINGLRMLRGSAQDLFLPEPGSLEYLHLARRLGYERQGEVDPALRLRAEFETMTAAVRVFVERRFGSGGLPGPYSGNVADIIMSDSMPREFAEKILSRRGFMNTKRALVNLSRLAGGGSARDVFASLAVLASDILEQKPDPDMALNNWERFAERLGDTGAHYRRMLSQPMRLDMLLGIFSTSQFLAEVLIAHPEFLDMVTDPRALHRAFAPGELELEIRGLAGNCSGEECRRALRLVRKREILRIGARDICLNRPLRDIVRDLSTLAEACVQAALECALASCSGASEGDDICVLAFGKLGGHELNYSSDVDLLALCGEGADREKISSLMESVSAHLSEHTADGYAYRVDLRLRPFGSAGPLVNSASDLIRYYGRDAAFWEVQALLKLRPVAGNLRMGEEFLHSLKPVLAKGYDAGSIARSIDALRDAAIRQSRAGVLSGVDVKNGEGGIRDIEFLAQGLQLINLPRHPELAGGNTLDALASLGSIGALPAHDAEELASHYIFLRRVEHFLQIYEDRQTHTLPRGEAELRALARKLMGSSATVESFSSHLELCRTRVRGAYVRFLLETYAR